MITYVNTVLVSNKNGATLATSSELEGVESKDALQGLVGKFVVMNCDPAKQDGSAIEDIYTIDGDVDTFKIGVIKNDFYTKFDKKKGKTVYIPKVKWSNEIKVADIKSLTVLSYQDDTEDVITIDFGGVDAETKDLLGAGGIPVVLRLTFKDMPTRYRNWTESYDYVTKPGDTAEDIVAGLAETISKQSRRARVYASVDGTSIVLEAMPYDDDNSNDSENFTGKVRFNATAWYSNPNAPGFASSNKYAIGEIKKTVGIQYPASAKNVRDHERTAQGYEGIMHRCCYFDPKPAIVADINNKYGGITLEFENMYRAADDIFRKTKQTVEIYASNAGAAMEPATIAGGLVAQLKAMISGRQNIINPVDNSKAYTADNFKKD